MRCGPSCPVNPSWRCAVETVSIFRLPRREPSSLVPPFSPPSPIHWRRARHRFVLRGTPWFSTAHSLERLLLLAAFSPTLTIVLTLLLCAPPSADGRADAHVLLMAVVTPASAPTGRHVTAVPRSLASSISPAISGAFLSTSVFGLGRSCLRRAEERLRLYCCFSCATSNRRRKGGSR